METLSQGALLTKSCTSRQLLVVLHRYVGLSIAGFLFVAGLTGSILAFEPELDAMMNPGLFRAVSAPSSPLLSLGELVERVEQSDERLRVTAALLAIERSQSVLLWVEPRTPVGSLGFDQLFVDPASAQPLGHRQWGACCFDRKQFIPFVYQVHMTLFLPAGAGALLMGGVAIAWLFDSIVGLMLAWPRSRTAGHGWSRVLRFKRGSRGFRAMFDLHRLAGLWPWPLLIASAITGISLNLREQIMQPLVEAISPLSPGPLDDPVGPDRPAPALSFDLAAERALASIKKQHVRPAVVYATHQAPLGLYGFAISEPVGNPRNGLGPSWVYVDDQSGSVRHRQIMGEGSGGDVFFQAQLPLHSGRIAGTAGRAVTAFYGIAVALLSLTGVYVWWRKRSARAQHRRKVAAGAIGPGR